MSGLITKGNWQKLKAKLIEDYPILTERNIRFNDGNEEKVIGELQQN